MKIKINFSDGGKNFYSTVAELDTRLENGRLMLHCRESELIQGESVEVCNLLVNRTMLRKISHSVDYGNPRLYVEDTILLNDYDRRTVMQMQIADIFREIGIPAKIKGYNYLRDGIIFLSDNPGVSITGTVYPNIAAHYRTTSSRVERAMRHAIEVAWSRGNIDFIDSLFAYTIDAKSGKPTNGEFISHIADILRLGNNLYITDEV